MKDGKPEPLWYEYRINKGYFYGPGAPIALRGLPVVFAPPLIDAEIAGLGVGE